MTTRGDAIHTGDVVRRYSHWVSDVVTFRMPHGAKVLHVGLAPSEHRGEFSVWALGNWANEEITRRIAIVTTGMEISERFTGWRHVGTWMTLTTVYHAFLDPNEHSITEEN